MMALAVAYGLALAAWPSPALIAAGVWWTSNTIAHNVIHRPFFRSRPANRVFALYLTVVLGIPQALWRDRHLAHHAGVEPRFRMSREVLLQCAAVLALWMTLLLRDPAWFATVYVPGYLAGLLLCADLTRTVDGPRH